jgi:hypothetical protein
VAGVGLDQRAFLVQAFVDVEGADPVVRQGEADPGVAAGRYSS